MSRCDKNGLPGRLNPKSSPKHAPLPFGVANVHRAVLELLENRLIPIDVALVRPTRKWIMNAGVVGENTVQELLRWTLQLL
jgi:hypothetical protein